MNRAGRFDRAYEIGLPDEELRLEYMKMRGFDIFLSEGEIKKRRKAYRRLFLCTAGRIICIFSPSMAPRRESSY